MAYVFANAYFSAIPLLPGVPRWLFELVRLVLLGGVVLPVTGAIRLLVRRDSRVNARAWLALGALVAGVLLSAMTLMQMSLPWLLG